MKHTTTTIIKSSAALLAFGIGPAFAQEQTPPKMKLTTEIHASVKIPDSVETPQGQNIQPNCKSLLFKELQRPVFSSLSPKVDVGYWFAKCWRLSTRMFSEP